MLSDSMHEVCESIWEAVKIYDYSEDHKEELVNALTELGYIVYKLDRMKCDIIWSKKDYRNNYVLKRWAEKNCSETD